ncbi:MAG: phosphoadenosine phosphosulfate reductase family protein [Gammaproteobacteria bacterium]|nr:phosphoadenosine phosphosulfate reductase family protein [Gammaproteobacteria bacterium]NNJ84347.1 phosphoadenosine phosphosulfate reductase family protein [Gammaproteobacteria bacterium]
MRWHEHALGADANTRHVLGLSGGKDSAALAIYLKDHYPEISRKIEYFFTDTGAELQEVYDTLDKLEAYLGKPITRLGNDKPFEYWLRQHNNYLPSPRQRWCTRIMKIEPFERFVGEDPVITYVGIRADEDREGYISRKPNIKALFPFAGDGIVRDDVFRILEETIGIPEYYQWRSRSGCYFCFFQRQGEWLGLKRRHPELFRQAARIEKHVAQRKFDWGTAEIHECGEGYTWNRAGPIEEIVRRAEEREQGNGHHKKKSTERWQDVLRFEIDDGAPDNQACLICSL